MSGDALVDAFFDQPSLLAVRFRLDLASRPVSAFAFTRRPDAAPGGSGRIGATIALGMVVAGVALVMAPSCTTSTRHTPVITATIATDCKQSTGWLSSLATLDDDLAPVPVLQPWYVRTLVSVPRELAARGNATGGWLQPRCASSDRTAHQQGTKLVRLLNESFAKSGLAVILDLPGPQAVAAAAAMAGAFAPILTIDNLPHPNGVVPAADTLGALIYWRPELAVRSAYRSNDPLLFILEGERLRAYGNEPGRFDNRSRARLPDATGFRALGIERILYVRQHRGTVVEADDLNGLFISCADSGIEVRHLALDSLDPLTPLAGERARRWFWQNYAWGRPAEVTVPARDDADAAYLSSPRTVNVPTPSLASQFDGGQTRRPEVIEQFLWGPSRGQGGSWWDSFTSSSSGGSWGRGTSSSFSGS